MSTTISIFKDWKPAGVFADVDYDDSAYQIFVNSLTGSDSSVIVSSPTPWTRLSVGQYSFSWTATTGVTYTVSSSLTYQGQTVTWTSTKFAYGQDMQAAGVYHTITDIQNDFGIDNVLIWSTLGPSDTNANRQARIQAVINWTESTVNSWFRRSRYSIPFASPCPLEITEICAHVSGAKLAEPRTTSDYSDQGQPLKTFVAARAKDALDTIKLILAGKLVLDADEKSDLSEAPMVVRTDRMHMREVRRDEIPLEWLANVILASDCRQVNVFSDR